MLTSHTARASTAEVVGSGASNAADGLSSGTTIGLVLGIITIVLVVIFVAMKCIHKEKGKAEKEWSYMQSRGAQARRDQETMMEINGFGTPASMRRDETRMLEIPAPARSPRRSGNISDDGFGSRTGEQRGNNRREERKNRDRGRTNRGGYELVGQHRQRAGDDHPETVWPLSPNPPSYSQPRKVSAPMIREARNASGPFGHILVPSKKDNRKGFEEDQRLVNGSHQGEGTETRASDR
jgi:hypothetical protein